MTRAGSKGALAMLLLLALCSCRALTTNETAALDGIYHPASARNPIDLSKIKIHNLSKSRDEAVADAKAQIAEEIETGRFKMARARMSAEQFQARVDAVLFKFGAITVGNNIFFAYYADDYSFLTNDFPLLAHEVMHVWQWQNRRITNYTLAEVAWEHIRYANPYAYEIVPGKRFLDYRYEQQGQMVQDYVCLKLFNQPGYKVRERLIEQAFNTRSLVQLASATMQSKADYCSIGRKR